MSAAARHPDTREIYLRHASTNGESYDSSHFVWSADRFIAAQQEAAAGLNADQPKGAPRLAKVEQITKEQYLKEKAA